MSQPPQPVSQQLVSQQELQRRENSLRKKLRIGRGREQQGSQQGSLSQHESPPQQAGWKSQQAGAPQQATSGWQQTGAASQQPIGARQQQGLNMRNKPASAFEDTNNVANANIGNTILAFMGGLLRQIESRGSG